MHGGKSTGPKTSEGRAVLAERFMVHGTQTRQIRAFHRAYMAEIERISRCLNLNKQKD